MTSENVLNYGGKAVRTSPWAIAALVLSIVGVLLFFLGLPAIVALVVALIVRKRIGSRLEVGGQNLATAAVVLSAWSVALFAGWAMLMPSTRSRVWSFRTRCAVNLKGIMNSMIIYANENGNTFPVVNFAPDLPRLNDPRGVAVKGTADDVIREMYKPTFADAGSTTANLWVLVLSGVSPKLFECRSDPFFSGAAYASDGSGGYYNNFQNGRQLSYSAAYAWRGDGKVGAWWKDTTDASLPLVADMTPMQGTGTPARNLSPPTTPVRASWNSANHEGDGQNVVFGDAHVDFSRQPNVGQDNDNIYSMSASPSLGPAQFGGIPAGTAAPNLMAEKAPFDIIMLPVRNATTGGM